MYINIPTQVFQSRSESHIYDILKSSWPAELCWSSLSRFNTRALSWSLRNCASSGKSTTTQKEMTPIITVAMPSKIWEFLSVAEVRSRVRQGEEASYENPSPAPLAANTVHICDGCRKKTTERTADRRGRKLRTISYPPRETRITQLTKIATRIPNSRRLYQQER